MARLLWNPTSGLLPWWIVHLAAAAALWLGLRRSRLRPSLPAGLALLSLSLLLPGRAALTGAVLGPVDLLFEFEPWRSQRQVLGVVRTSPELFGDVWQQMIPWQRVVREAWLGGEWPLWNPYMLAGTPLASAFSPAPYWPPTLLSLLVPFVEVFTLLVALKILLAALSAFLFFRDQECEEGAALVGATAWTFSTFQLFWLGWPQTSVTCLAPLALLGAARAARAPSVRSTVLLGGALALAALAGHGETLLHLVALAVACFAWTWWRAEDRGRWRSRLVAGTVAGALALGLSAISLLPFADDLGETAHLAAREAFTQSPKRGVSLALSSKAALAQVVPFRFGVAGKAETADPKPHESFSTAYVGSAVFVLAAIGLVASRRREKWFWALAGALGLAAGCSFRPLMKLLHRLPWFDIAVNQRLVFVAALAFAALAAFGWQRWWSPGEGGPPPRRQRLAVGGLAIAASAGMVAALWRPLTSLGLAGELLAREAAIYLGAVVALTLVLVAARRGNRAAYAVVALIAGQRFAEAGHFHTGVPAAWFYPEVPVLERAERAPDGFRFAGAGLVMPANTATALGLEDVRGYEPMTLARLDQTYPLWSDERAAAFRPIWSLDRPFLSFLGVRRVLAQRSVRVPEGWRSVASGPRLQVLDNPAALPLAFVPARLRRVADPTRTVAEMAAADSFADAAWLELPAGERPTAADWIDNAAGAVESVRRIGLGRYRVVARFERPGWIVTSIPAWPGWRARADGPAVATAIANHAFVAVRAPAGVATITLRYLPRTFVLGAWLSALSVLAVAITATVAARRARNRPVGGRGVEARRG